MRRWMGRPPWPASSTTGNRRLRSSLSELWPNLISAAQARGVKLALLSSARMTEKSAKRLAALPGFGPRPSLSLRPDPAAGGGDEEAAFERWAQDRRPVNLKLVGDPLPADETELARLKAAAGGRRILLAASTHAGEEAILARVFQDVDCDHTCSSSPPPSGRGAEVADLFPDRSRDARPARR